jgi:nucleoside-diphosphate-sugar epimerase
LVHVSSYVYGAPHRLPVDEDHPLAAFNPYGHSKILAEAVVDFHRQQLGARATVLRPFNLYGPGQPARFLVASIVRQVLDPACTAIAVADATPRRDYLHVRDFVALIVAALRADAGGTYNAGSGASASVAEVADLARRAAGVDKPLRATGARRPNEILDVVADIARAARELGWRPRVTLSEGLAELVANGDATDRA